MSEHNQRKLNRLLSEMGDTDLVSSRWLRAHGYSSSLVSRYVASGWLVSPARGVYMRKGGRLRWEGVVHSLQAREALPLHVGGRFALAWEGYEHYLQLGQAAMVSLYGPERVPGWTAKLPLPERFRACGKGPFDFPALSFASDVPEHVLLDQGLQRRADLQGAVSIVCSTPERAILELCDQVRDAALVYEVDALLQGMANLRPRRVTQMLAHCQSIKAKRVFMALAERHQHAWLLRVSLDGVNFGSGKRSLVPSGRLHPTYQITLPGDLDEYLG